MNDLFFGSLGINESDDYSLNLLRAVAITLFLQRLHEENQLACAAESSFGDFPPDLEPIRDTMPQQYAGIGRRFVPFGSVSLGQMMQEGESEHEFVIKYPGDLDLASYSSGTAGDLRRSAEAFAAEYNGSCVGVGEGYGPEDEARFFKLAKIHGQFKDSHLQSMVAVVRLTPQAVLSLLPDTEVRSPAHFYLGDDELELKTWVENGKFKPEIVEQFRETYDAYAKSMAEAGKTAVDPSLLKPGEDSIPVVFSIESRYELPLPVLSPVVSNLEHITDSTSYKRNALIQNPVQELVNKIGYFISHEPNPASPMDAAAMMDFMIHYERVQEELGQEFCEETLPRLVLQMIPTLKKYHEHCNNGHELGEKLNGYYQMKFDADAFTDRHFSSYRVQGTQYGDTLDYEEELEGAHEYYRELTERMTRKITPEEVTYLDDAAKLRLKPDLLPQVTRQAEALIGQISPAIDAANEEHEGEHPIPLLSTGLHGFKSAEYVEQLSANVAFAAAEAARAKNSRVEKT